MVLWFPAVFKAFSRVVMLPMCSDSKSECFKCIASCFCWFKSHWSVLFENKNHNLFLARTTLHPTPPSTAPWSHLQVGGAVYNYNHPIGEPMITTSLPLPTAVRPPISFRPASNAQTFRPPTLPCVLVVLTAGPRGYYTIHTLDIPTLPLLGHSLVKANAFIRWCVFNWEFCTQVDDTIWELASE